MNWQPLIDAALEARGNAYAPHSGFAVGAALQATDGTIIPGCNVENRSYGLTICAERNAVAAANALGLREFDALVVVADAKPPARPCGMCLDTLAEFAPQIPVLLINLAGDSEELTLDQLLPQPFRFP